MLRRLNVQSQAEIPRTWIADSQKWEIENWKLSGCNGSKSGKVGQLHWCTNNCKKDPTGLEFAPFSPKFFFGACVGACSFAQ
jgi:hypothetical protein